MALSPESRGQSTVWMPILLSDSKILGVPGCLQLGESYENHGTVCQVHIQSCKGLVLTGMYRSCWSGGFPVSQFLLA